MRSGGLSYNFRVESGQKMGILRAYLNWKPGGILKHRSHLFVVMLVSLNCKHLTIFEVHGKEVLMMGHETHDRSYSERKNASYNAADPVVVGILAIVQLLNLGHWNGHCVDWAALLAVKRKHTGGRTQRVMPILQV